jgi:hypothetical protein
MSTGEIIEYLGCVIVFDVDFMDFYFWSRYIGTYYGRNKSFEFINRGCREVLDFHFEDMVQWVVPRCVAPDSDALAHVATENW